MRPMRSDHPGFSLLSAAAGGALLALAAGLSVYGLRLDSERKAEAEALTGGHADRALPLLRRYGCAGCHDIPGIPGADGQVGGSLTGLRNRVYIAGILPNTSDNLIRWIVSPPAFSPKTAMPETGISTDEARDVAAYLYAR